MSAPTHSACGCQSCHSSSAPPPDTETPIPAMAHGRQSRILVPQMCCPTEEGMIRRKLAGQAGVHGMTFNLLKRELTVSHAEDALAAILADLAALGFSPKLLAPAARTESAPQTPPQPWWPLVLAGVLALAAEGAHWAGLGLWLEAALALAAIGGSGTATYRKGWLALRHGDLNINALMSIAVTGALIIGQWPEAAMVMVLFTLAERIEARSLGRVRHAIEGLLAMAPAQATVLDPDGGEQRRPVEQVAMGAIVRIRPGERIPLDGRVIAGRSSVDQAPITGESVPVDKAGGDLLFAGTLNQGGELQMEVMAPADDSLLARIIHAVESAQASRAPIQQLVDRFARVYTPAVVLVALLVALLPPLWLGDWLTWCYRALVLLVIACPCALVISTPVTLVSSLAAAARHGILIKGGAFLELAEQLNWLAFDKTGTLTRGQPSLVETQIWAEAGEHALCQVAASLAARSDHPVSRAVTQAVGDAERLPVTDFTAMPGRGVRGFVNGQGYWLGNPRLMKELGFGTPALLARLEPMEAAGKSLVLLASDDAGVLGLFAVADTLKPGSREAIAQLHDLGIQTLMLSGDNPHVATAIAAEAGLGEAHGGLLPEDKQQLIADLRRQGHKVGMVGDGINDAPALASADMGIAMGAAGSDTAIETADVALMNDDLRSLPTLIRLSRHTRRRLRQNIALALGIKGLFLALTLAGYGTMWMAVFADMGASLLVVFNGLRLSRY